MLWAGVVEYMTLADSTCVEGGGKGVGHFVVGTTQNYHFFDAAPILLPNLFPFFRARALREEKEG